MSSAPRVLRTTLRRTASCNRYSSTQASSSTLPSAPSSSNLDVQPKAKLPADKMRALVELYHRSAGFITKENLSQRIDEVFIWAPNEGGNSASFMNREGWPQALSNDLRKRSEMSKFGRRVDTSRSKAGADVDWSQIRDSKDMAIVHALFGVHGRGLPAYDALIDEVEARKRRVEVDERTQEERVENDEGEQTTGKNEDL